MAHKIEISARTIVFTVVFLIFLNILWQIRELIYALFISFIFMSALKPLVSFVKRFKFPHGLSVMLVYFMTLFILIFTFSFILPPLIIESFQFFRSLPLLLEKSYPMVANLINVDSFKSFFPNVTENAVKVISGIFSNVFFIITVLFFTFYFLLEERFLRNVLSRFLRNDQVDVIVGMFDKVEKRMSAWVWGEIALMTIIGLFSFAGLLLIGIRYAGPLAVIAGFLEVVPMIGPIISTVPAFFVASSTSWVLGVSVIVFYIVIQQLENNLIVPIVMKKAVGLNPIITLIALTIGGKLGGIIGILLSVPTALFIETFFVEYIHLRTDKKVETNSNERNE